MQTRATNNFLAKAAMFEFHDFEVTSALRKQHMAMSFLNFVSISAFELNFGCKKMGNSDTERSKN